MKKFVLFTALVLSALSFVACTGSSNGPDAVAKKAISAIQKGDFDAYAATFNLPESDQKMLAGMAQEKLAGQLETKGGIKSYEITDSTIDEDKAVVKVHLVYKDGSEDDQVMNFVKVEDEWKQEMKK